MAGLSQAQYASANLQARNYVLANSVELIQNINEGVGTFDPASTPVVTIKPKMAGLIKGVFIKIVATVNNTATAAAGTVSPLGAAQMFSSVIFTDTNNIQRINTDGFGLSQNNTLRFGSPLGSQKSFPSTTSTLGSYGENYNVVNIPQTLAAGDNTVTFYLYVPMAYSFDDLRGAMFGDVVNSSSGIQLTFNPNAVTANATLTAGCMYYNVSGSVTSVTITAKQVYQDKLPPFKGSGLPAEFDNGGLALPTADLGTYYQLLKSVPNITLAAGQQSDIPYAPLRSYLTTSLAYINFNGTTSNTAQISAASDISNIVLGGANEFVWVQSDPDFESLLVNQKYGFDLPIGNYLINRRHSPINTISYGNMYIKITPAVVNAGAYFITYNEYFAFAGVTSQQQAIS